jgi:predicted cupin superfamily sugar epimerase
MDIKWLIEHFGLQELPVEGGIFTQTYVSAERLPPDSLPERYGVEKPFGTAIVYLLTPDANSFSAMHRLPTDEVYHFYLGDPVEMLQLYPGGHSEHVILGQDLMAGQRVQYVAPRGMWQGSHLFAGGEYALIGTTMAPGFTPDDYLGGTREELIEAYPHEADLITTLTRLGEGIRRMDG